MNKKRFIKFIVLVFLLVNTLTLSACGGGLAGLFDFDTKPDRQVFPPFTTEQEQQFTDWAKSMALNNDVPGIVYNIGAWMQANMTYAPGRDPLDWPGYQSWGKSVNCEGFSQVAIEALRRVGVDDFRLLVVYYPGNWHVVCASKRMWISNPATMIIDGEKKTRCWGWIVGYNLTWADVAAQIGDLVGQTYTVSKYQVFTRDLTLEQEGAPNYKPPAIPDYALVPEQKGR